jgi:hypothetical protein
VLLQQERTSKLDKAKLHPSKSGGALSKLDERQTLKEKSPAPLEKSLWDVVAMAKQRMG